MKKEQEIFKQDLDKCKTQDEIDLCHRKYIIFVTDNDELLRDIYKKRYEIIEQTIINIS